jgi:hypothetical protein
MSPSYPCVAGVLAGAAVLDPTSSASGTGYGTSPSFVLAQSHKLSRGRLRYPTCWSRTMCGAPFTIRADSSPFDWASTLLANP